MLVQHDPQPVLQRCCLLPHLIGHVHPPVLVVRPVVDRRGEQIEVEVVLVAAAELADQLRLDRPVQAVHVEIDVCRNLDALGQRGDEGLAAVASALGGAAALPLLVVPDRELPGVLGSDVDPRQSLGQVGLPLHHQARELEHGGGSCRVVVGPLRGASRVLYPYDDLLAVADGVVVAPDDDPRVRVLSFHGGDVVAAVFAQLGGEVLHLDLVAQVLEPQLHEVAGIGVGDGVDLAIPKVGEGLDVIDYSDSRRHRRGRAVLELLLQLPNLLDCVLHCYEEECSGQPG